MCEYLTIGNCDDKYLNKVLCFFPTVLRTFPHILQYYLKIWFSMCVGSVLHLFNQVCFFIKFILSQMSLIGSNEHFKFPWLYYQVALQMGYIMFYTPQSIYLQNIESVYFMSCLLDSAFIKYLCPLPFPFHRNVCLRYRFVRPLYILNP